MQHIIQQHIPCPDCGSHDALCVYDDGHSYCFSCEKYTANYDSDVQKTEETHYTSVSDMVILPLKNRGISANTCKKFHYYCGQYKGKPCQVAVYYDDTGKEIGKKIRFKDKSFKQWGSINDRFYGQELWQGNDKMKLIITEGEIDCLTVAQVLDNKYPVVSIPSGVTSAHKVISKNLDWLSTFSEVILMFDMDEQGRKAVADCIGLLQNMKVAVLPYKDPNECLLKGEEKAIISAIWNAKECKPDGIVNGVDIWEAVSSTEDLAGYNYQWEIPLNSMTYGLRKGELVVITAGTGVGKTTFVRSIMYDLAINKGLKIGVMMLEENIRRTALGLMSLHVGKRLYLHRSSISDDEFSTAFKETLGTGRFVLYNHFGSLDGSNLLSKIRYMAITEKCDFIVLDHISIAISGLEGENERKLLDYLMTQIRSIVEETGVGMIVISHLRRVSNNEKSHEEGGQTSLADLRGSHSISQLSDVVIGLERNQQDKEEETRNVIKIRVLKNRPVGETGIGGLLSYDRESDKLIEYVPSPTNDDDEGVKW